MLISYFIYNFCVFVTGLALLSENILTVNSVNSEFENFLILP